MMGETTIRLNFWVLVLLQYNFDLPEKYVERIDTLWCDTEYMFRFGTDELDVVETVITPLMAMTSSDYTVEFHSGEAEIVNTSDAGFFSPRGKGLEYIDRITDSNGTDYSMIALEYDHILSPDDLPYIDGIIVAEHNVCLLFNSPERLTMGQLRF